MTKNLGNNCDICIPILKASKFEHAPIKTLYKNFIKEYKAKPSFFVKVPGRVNIIGEHIDYCGFPVLPMAIEQNLTIAVVSTNDSILNLRNVNENYDSFKCDLKSLTFKNSSNGVPHWSNYFLCGVKGVFEYYNIIPSSRGMCVLVTGNIPEASGLSSSSALVCSAVIATSFLFEVQLHTNILAEIAAKCERYVGTEGGGMDQAIALLAEVGCAKFIKFLPTLNAESIKLPNSVYFVVANSLTKMNKAATSDFNQRVIECKLSCRLLAKKLKLKNWKEITQLAVLQNLINCTLNELLEIAEKLIDKDLYLIDEICNEFEVNETELKEKFLTQNTKHIQKFKLRQRTLHVLQESMRVQKFYEICKSGSNDIDTLSKLIKKSHESLNLLYECSHPNLEKLIEISNNVGVAARLTGAGWGGCIVALCNSLEKSNQYIKELKDNYYQHLPEAKELNFHNIVFSTLPSSGAQIFILEE